MANPIITVRWFDLELYRVDLVVEHSSVQTFRELVGRTFDAAGLNRYAWDVHFHMQESNSRCDRYGAPHLMSGEAWNNQTWMRGIGDSFELFAHFVRRDGSNASPRASTGQSALPIRVNTQATLHRPSGSSTQETTQEAALPFRTRSLPEQRRAFLPSQEIETSIERTRASRGGEASEFNPFGSSPPSNPRSSGVEGGMLDPDGSSDSSEEEELSGGPQQQQQQGLTNRGSYTSSSGQTNEADAGSTAPALSSEGDTSPTAPALTNGVHTDVGQEILAHEQRQAQAEAQAQAQAQAQTNGRNRQLPAIRVNGVPVNDRPMTPDFVSEEERNGRGGS